MSDVIETIKYRGYEIEIRQDDIEDGPRGWDNLGTMVCFHRNYNLGDKHGLSRDQFSGWNDMQSYLIKEEGAIVILPLFLYDHSGITMSVGNFNHLGMHGYFDSGQVGFIYVNRKGMKLTGYGENWKKITATRRKKLEEQLCQEVETYDQYLGGDVYGYSVGDIGSCWGFYGYDHEKSGLLENARDAIDRQIDSVRKEHFIQLKIWIKNRVPFYARKPMGMEMA